MNELWVVAGYIIFLCIFGWRGFLISAAVVGALTCIFVVYPMYQGRAEQAATDARQQAECIAHPPAAGSFAAVLYCSD